jgi:hypothetical protein
MPYARDRAQLDWCSRCAIPRAGKAKGAEGPARAVTRFEVHAVDRREASQCLRLQQHRHTHTCSTRFRSPATLGSNRPRQAASRSRPASGEPGGQGRPAFSAHGARVTHISFGGACGCGAGRAQLDAPRGRRPRQGRGSTQSSIGRLQDSSLEALARPMRQHGSSPGRAQPRTQGWVHKSTARAHPALLKTKRQHS